MWRARSDNFAVPQLPPPKRTATSVASSSRKTAPQDLDAKAAAAEPAPSDASSVTVKNSASPAAEMPPPREDEDARQLPSDGGQDAQAPRGEQVPNPIRASDVPPPSPQRASQSTAADSSDLETCREFEKRLDATVASLRASEQALQESALSLVLLDNEVIHMSSPAFWKKVRPHYSRLPSVLKVLRQAEEARARIAALLG
jgi:hypothetical protein